MAVWLGVDVGTVRVGVARSDATGLLATPLTTLRRDARTDADVAELVALAAEWEAEGVVVGLPITLRGRDGPAAALARRYAAALAAAAPGLRVEFIDERNTTVTAQRELRAAGVDARAARGRVDARAAAVLLQLWLDRARAAPRVTPPRAGDPRPAPPVHDGPTNPSTPDPGAPDPRSADPRTPNVRPPTPTPAPGVPPGRHPADGEVLR